MNVQVAGRDEHLVAVGAGVREGSLPQVCALVPLHVLPPQEGLAAGAALVRLDSGVDAQVARERLPLGEALAALSAGVRTLARVRVLVRRHVARGHKRLAAVGAGEGSIARVQAFVHDKAGLLRVRLPTLATREQLLSRVRTLVNFDLSLGPEVFLADRARVDFGFVLRVCVCGWCQGGCGCGGGGVLSLCV